ncbi:MAG: glycosyltransferase family 4 protein [Syntrophobacteraceae bacterium]|jgi:glycosyltransferase involved in cell wall biosynthesis|nr:glycosyltransferase family 4 protein [Syntrophobacteraceae bacterium]
MKGPGGVTILHTEASDGWGGQEIRIYREMLGIQGRGYRVLLASPPGAIIHQRAAAAGIPVISVAMDRLHFPSAVSHLRRVILENGVDLVNTHSSADSWIGSLAGRLAGAAVLRTRHISSPVKGGMLNRFLYGRLCREVMTTGEFIRSQLIRDLRLDPARVRSVPTGVDLAGFSSPDGSCFRLAHGIPLDAPVLGIAAVLRSWKGHKVLLEAMKPILQAFPEARLCIVGDGPMRKVIEARIGELGLQDRVLMTGYREDVVQVIAAFDIAVMASYASEGIPQFALQAMALSKPVVATRVGGIPEVVLHGETGLLAEPKDPASLAEAVLALLADPALRKKLGDNGRRRAATRHSFEGMLDQVEECYHRLLRTSGSTTDAGEPRPE